MPERLETRTTGGFAARLHEVIDAHSSASTIAKAIGRSEGAVRKWLRGESEPNVTDLRALCELTGTGVEWLVTGRGRRESPPSELQERAPPSYTNTTHKPLDYSLLESVMDAVDAEVRSSATELPTTKRSMLVVTLYDLCQESGQVDRGAVARLLRLAR